MSIEWVKEKQGYIICLGMGGDEKSQEQFIILNIPILFD